MNPAVHVSRDLLEIKDFGVFPSASGTLFRVWSPTSESVKVALYETWNHYYRNEYPMTREPNGCWVLTVPENLTGKYYTYLVTRHGQCFEVVDPWVKSSGPNSKRGFIADLSQTNPPGWETHPVPPMLERGHLLIYEVHIRDLSVGPSSGNTRRGKYLCLTETETKTPGGLSTGVAYLKELGVSHVHILPVADFATVDELNPVEYNWGYDPVLYNVPEGSYASDAVDGHVRVRELKEAIMALHKAGIRVVLDVVYNHTFHGEKSAFNYLVPNYYYRTDFDNRFTNGSGVGNELATEHPMVRKFVVDSLKYWLTEYRVDGFRFDLLGLYDIETVRTLCDELTALRPDILLYGEPWIGGQSGLPENHRFLKGAQRGLPIAVFNDDFRNDLKGSNDGFEEGFITGRTGNEAWVALGLTGNITLGPNFAGFSDVPGETVNYLSCHDNLCLYDKIMKVEPGQSFEKHKAMTRLGLSMLLSAFGLPFVALGTEFMRTKFGNHNSYNAPDSVNQVDWTARENNDDLVRFFRDFLEFRRSQKMFASPSAEVIRKNVHILLQKENTVVISVTSPFAGDYSEVLFIHYAGWADMTLSLPGIGGMKLLCDGETLFGRDKMETITEDMIAVKGIRTVLLIRE